MSEPRVKAFRILKPPCVELSQNVLKFKARKIAPKELNTSIENLHDVLRTISKETDAMDARLADYVFFPLSHIFRDAKVVPMRATEIALRILHILISRGWKSEISPDMGKQLLILSCFLAGGNLLESEAKTVHEEVDEIAFECLATLCQSSGIAGLVSHESGDHKPILGHAVTITLDGVARGPTTNIRLAALNALRVLLESIADIEVLKTVFPGVVSAITKVLSAKASSKVSYQVIAKGLDVLAMILRRVMSDDIVFRQKEITYDGSSPTTTQDAPTDAWVEATSSQVKMALANLLPLRYHEKAEVQTELLRLCESVIQHCRKSLHQSIALLVDTLVVLCSNSNQDYKTFLSANGANGTPLAIDAPLLETLKGSLHGWIMALPRAVQSNDESRRIRSVDQIRTAFSILEAHEANLDLLDDFMLENLHASVSTAIHDVTMKKIYDAPENKLQITQGLLLEKNESTSLSFKPIFVSTPGNRATMKALLALAERLKSPSAAIQQKIGTKLRNSTGNDQLATLCLSIEFSKSIFENNATVDHYLVNPLLQDNHLLNETFAFALEKLQVSTFSVAETWQLQALCLEVIALESQRQGADFRPELVDALYPILERLGSNNAPLQQHAMICLNIVSKACAYQNPAALVVENADYLVNAIALKLNTFDVSPQAPQVLMMMIRLCGGALIPYLDDLIESIFAILSCYHGYPKLVESMFEVLYAVVEEAGKGSVPLVEGPKRDTTTRPQRSRPMIIADLARMLRSRRDIEIQSLSPPPSPSSTAPSVPLQENKHDPSEEDIDPKDLDELPPADPPAPKPTKTFQLLTSIINLSPAHITSPSPALRSRILELMTKSFPLLARETNSFLPIAATLWPYVTTRLFNDDEPYILLSAVNALTALCSSAGDFLASRIDDDWGKLRVLYLKAEKGMHEEMRAQKGVKGMRWRVWEAIIDLFMVCLKDVGVTDETMDEVFELLGSVMKEAKLKGPREKEVRQCLEDLDADRLWLLEMEDGVPEKIQSIQVPIGEEQLQFKKMWAYLP